jgi:hypothetical protein
VDFTREPIIETVITPKEGCKLVVRSSKSVGQEEYFVDAVEVVSFGNSFFFRSLERPKAFLVPASDYELLEVREARMVLKNVGLDRAIKIAGGREGQIRPGREPVIQGKAEPAPTAEESFPAELAEGTQQVSEKAEGKLDKKRDRRRHYRRRRGREDAGVRDELAGEGSEEELGEAEKGALGKPEKELRKFDEGQEAPSIPGHPVTSTPSILTSLLPPPPTLISETIARYKDNVLFKGAFYLKEEAKEKEAQEAEKAKHKIPLQQPAYGSFEVSEEEEEEIYRQRKMQSLSEKKDKEEEKASSEDQTNDHEAPNESKKEEPSNGNAFS